MLDITSPSCLSARDHVWKRTEPNQNQNQNRSRPASKTIAHQVCLAHLAAIKQDSSSIRFWNLSIYPSFLTVDLWSSNMTASDLAQIETDWNVAFAIEMIIWILALISLLLRAVPKCKDKQNWNLSDSLMMLAFVTCLVPSKLSNRRADLHRVSPLSHQSCSLHVDLLTRLLWWADRHFRSSCKTNGSGHTDRGWRLSYP